jgi:catechol 2,3-dioxygenase-like lactoylglutathione lyase family enzyme
VFAYVCLGTDDIARARAFWDAVLAPLGHARVAGYDDAASSAWGADDPGVHLWVARPFDGRPARAGNGAMVSLAAPSRAAVDAAHAAALAAGGTCAGPPGLRPQYGPGFYAACFRDPDGNKANAVHDGPDPGQDR